MGDLKSCWHCMNQYRPTRSDQMYCSKRCRLNHYRSVKNAVKEDEAKEWVIERCSANYGIGGGFDISYYTGKTYSFACEDYGEFLDWNQRNESKKYTSKKRAENAMAKLIVRVANAEKLKVKPFKDVY